MIQQHNAEIRHELFYLMTELSDGKAMNAERLRLIEWRITALEAELVDVFDSENEEHAG